MPILELDAFVALADFDIATSCCRAAVSLPLVYLCLLALLHPSRCRLSSLCPPFVFVVMKIFS